MPLPATLFLVVVVFFLPFLYIKARACANCTFRLFRGAEIVHSLYHNKVEIVPFLTQLLLFVLEVLAACECKHTRAVKKKKR